MRKIYISGTYGSREGLVEEAECSPCSGGEYCETEGLAAPTGDCDAGYYCTEGKPSAPLYTHKNVTNVMIKLAFESPVIYYSKIFVS